MTIAYYYYFIRKQEYIWNPHEKDIKNVSNT